LGIARVLHRGTFGGGGLLATTASSAVVQAEKTVAAHQQKECMIRTGFRAPKWQIHLNTAKSREKADNHCGDYTHKITGKMKRLCERTMLTGNWSAIG